MDEKKPDDLLDLGVAILTTFVHNDPQGFTLLTRDLPGGNSEAIAALGRVCEALVGMIAEMAGMSKEESLERIAAAFATAD
ncbi:hypothetical protein QFZ79_001094 [Arthrobacter sp. V4I6]|uniref:hypothetical protein n=1 Tax=unclassified Arthrobacter TaxID=235627 RepID=UPI00278640F2|nr:MULTISPECIES: hypothetical protein [unclassified Arthrobacter]MDQ0823350.1 hypothetical protein [Arthrobacter sp. V1I7]MDQ0852983.1 hypothetical protein [Arthrobacter sp. V4I6]